MNDDGEKFGKKEMRGNKNPAGLAALRDERYVEEMYYSSIQFSIVIPSTRLKCFALFVTIILKSASNLNGNLNCSKELEHYAS